MKRKVAKKDFTVSNLPSSRKEVFFDCLKVNFKTLVSTGLSLFLSSLPLLICLVLKKLYILNIENMLSEGKIEAAEYSTTLLIYKIIFNACICVSSLVASIGISGSTRIIRQLSWEEPLFFKSDYNDGVKKNYKQIFIFVLIYSLVYSLVDIALVADIDNILLSSIPSAILSFIFTPMLLYNLSQVNVYKVSAPKAIMNSMKLFIKTAPVSLLFALIIYLFNFARFIPSYGSIVVYVVLIIIGLPIMYLAWFLYSLNVFDKYINPDQFPEMIGKGLVNKELENEKHEN